MHASELDEFGFRRHDREFILVAGSSDVVEERGIVERELKDEISELGENVQVYAYDIEHDGRVMDQRTTMQRNIPRPSAPNCKGVVYVLGERIGMPLEDGPYAHHLGASNCWAEASPYCLKLDWPKDEEEAKGLLNDGAFPLSGGVFEYLAARGAREDDDGLGTPTLFILLAKEAVTSGSGMIVLNENRWANKMTTDMPLDMKRRWEDDNYWPQITGVHNFLRAMYRERIDQNPTLDPEKIARDARNFVRHDVFGREEEQRNPYRELGYYDLRHSEFYGRRDFVDSLLRSFVGRLKQPNQIAACYISGRSGSGKSSVLRAGVVRRLLDVSERGRNFCVILRPDMFKDVAGCDLPIIETVLDAIELQQGPSLAHGVRPSIRKAGASAPHEAAAAILAALANQPHPPRSFVIALDQFEEIVDELASSKRREYWQPLLNLLEKLADEKATTAKPKNPLSFGLIFTLESGRKGQLKKISLAEPFKSAFEEELTDADDTFLKRIIRRPFDKTHYHLDESVVNELMKQFKQLRDEDERASRNSVLSLLSLKLYGLWENVAANFERVTDNRIGGSEMSGSADKISLDALKKSGWDPSIGSVLNDLATKAWRRANVGPAEGFNLSAFLQPLVGVEGRGGNVQLTKARRHAPYENERKVIESFRACRLLIDVGDNSVRLIHQAVLAYWDAAQEWLESNRDFLEKEAKMRVEARNWEAQGRPMIRSRGKPLNHKIDTAARILGEYLRAWSYEDNPLDDDDLILRDYCLGLFSKSDEPRRPVVQVPQPEGSFVGMAATYGLNALLESFAKKDRGALEELVSPAEDASPPLYKAAWAHTDTVRYLLRERVDPIGKTRHGWPALAASIQCGNTDTFRLLLGAAKDRVNGLSLEQLLACPNGQSLVHLASRRNETGMLRELVEKSGFAFDAVDDLGEMPIHSACRNDSIRAFDYLRTLTSIEVLTTPHEHTCLHLAAAMGAEKVIDRILSLAEGKGLVEQTNELGLTAVALAARHRQADCVAALLSFPADPSTGAAPALHMLFHGVPGAIVGESNERLLEKPGFESTRAVFVHLDQEGGITDLQKGDRILSDIGIQAEQRSNILASLAENFLRTDGCLDVDRAVDRMTRRDNVADENYDEEHALATLRALLRSTGLDPNVPNEFGRRPIGIIAEVRPLLLELLKDRRIDLSLPIDQTGELGILLAARVGAWSAVRRHLDTHGVPEGVNAEDNGDTFLHHLLVKRAPHDLVFDHVSDFDDEQLNAKNARGQSPIQRAIRNKNWDIARQMIETGLVELHSDDRATDWELHDALVLGAPDDFICRLTGCLGSDGLSKKDEDGWTILHHMVGANAVQPLEKLVSCDVDLEGLWEMRNDSGQTPGDLAGQLVRVHVPETHFTGYASETMTWDADLVWEQVSETRRKSTIAALGNLADRAERLIVEQAALPFYPRKKIVRARHSSNGRTRPTFYFLASGRTLSRLDGTSPPIHAFNKDHLKLTSETARRYLHFFCFFARGEDGPFFILEDPDAPLLSNNFEEEDRSKVRDFAMPVITRGTSEGQFRFLGRVFYSNAIFAAYFRVEESGMIEMEEDIPVAAELSGGVDMPIS